MKNRCGLRKQNGNGDPGELSEQFEDIVQGKNIGLLEAIQMVAGLATIIGFLFVIFRK